MATSIAISMRGILQVAVLLAGLLPLPAAAQNHFGAQGPEALPDRRQQWLVPSSDPQVASRAVLFRPAGAGPFPLAVIAHASTQNALRRAQTPQPEYRTLAHWLVARGYAVLVPERLGHGETGGRYREDQGSCDDANYLRAGRATAAAIAATLTFLREQPFIRNGGALVIGHSAGAWGTLALAQGNSKAIAQIVAFAPGRGGHADDRPNQICAPQNLIAAAREFGQGARIPVLWLVANNDSYFAPGISRQLSEAFGAGGDKVDFRVLPPFGDEGHWLAERDGGAAIYGPMLDAVIKDDALRQPKR